MDEDTRILSANQLTGKSEIELLQLKGFYEKKLKVYEKRNPLSSASRAFRKRWGLYAGITLSVLMLMFLSFYYYIILNNIILLFLSGVGLLWVMIFAMMMRPPHEVSCLKNLENINLMIESSKSLALTKKPKESVESKKLILVYDCLKFLKESNLTKLKEELSKRGTPITEKTIRKHLEHLISKKLVIVREAPYESPKRKLDSTKIYSIRESSL